MKPPVLHQNNFDVLRLFAALQVVVLHYSVHIGEISPQGLLEAALRPFAGVPIFFFISGFLIAESWVRKPLWREYVWRRAMRIFPAMMMCGVLAIASLMLSGFGTPLWLDRPWFYGFALAQISGFAYYNPSALSGYGVGVLNGSLWTIPVELSFYIALPMLFLLFRAITLRLAIIFVAMLVSYALYEFSWKWRAESVLWRGVSLTLAAHGWEFLLGVLAQHYKAYLLRILRGRALMALLVFVATYAVLGDVVYLTEGAARPWYASFALAVLRDAWVFAFAFSPIYCAHFLRGNDISYGVYLYHMPVLNAAIYLGFGALPAIVLTVCLALLSWRLIEAPCLARTTKRRAT